MRLVIAVLTGLIALLPVTGDGAGATWPDRRVRVYDHTPAAWRPLVAEAVAAINTQRAKNAPRLRYRAAREGCRSHKRGISVCSVPNMVAMGFATYRPRHRKITRARIVVSDMYLAKDGLNTVCHELFHALADAPERVVPDAESCPYNKRFARRVYRKHR